MYCFDVGGVVRGLTPARVHDISATTVRLAALKQPTLLKYTSTAKVDELGKFYNLLEGLGMLKLDLPGLARRDLYNI